MKTSLGDYSYCLINVKRDETKLREQRKAQENPQQDKDHGKTEVRDRPRQASSCNKGGNRTGYGGRPHWSILWGRRTPQFKRSQKRIIGCMPELKIPHDIRGMMGRLDKDMTAREFCVDLHGPGKLQSNSEPETLHRKEPHETERLHRRKCTQPERAALGTGRFGSLVAAEEGGTHQRGSSNHEDREKRRRLDAMGCF